MKIKYKLSRLLVALLLVMSHMPWGATAFAQETIDVVMNVFLQVQGGEANVQSQISYDILNESKSEFIWSYRSNEPPQEGLSLAPGNYVFRLYDGGGFVRDGSEIGSKKVEQTIAQKTEDDIANNRTKVELANKGEVLTQGDGSKVYDLPFTVTSGPDLLNGTTTELDIYLADTVSLNEESSEGAETSEPESETSQVTFTVIDENSQPVSGVTIQLGEQQVVTTDQGIAQFDDFQAGEFMLNIVAMPQGFIGELNDMLLVEPGQVIDITLNVTTAAPAVGSLSFKVVDQNQAPVSGVVIQVDESQVTTNELGEVTISELPIGDYDYSVVALPEGYSGDIVSSANVTADATSEEVLTITKDVPQAAGVNFVVVDQEGSAVSGATITINDQEITTDESGAASLSDLLLGDYAYTLVALPEGYTGDVTGTVTVSLDVTEPIQLIVERTPELGSASFELVDQDGNAVPGATITINDQQITTNESGVASLSELPLGTYEYNLVGLPEGYTGEASGELTITTEVIEPIQLIVEREPELGTASFKVVDQDGNAVPGATITINDQQITTNEFGAASLSELPLGTYEYNLVGLPEGYTGEASGEFTLTTETIDPVQLTVERPPQLGSASFEVVDQDANPVIGATININEQEVTTDAEGQVSVTGLAVGDYPYNVVSLPDGYSGEATGTVAILEGETTTTSIKITKDAQYGDITFTVKDQQQQPVVGAVIRMNERDFTTNIDGEAIILEVEAGRDFNYQLFSLPEGYTGQVQGVVQATVNETVTEEISVQREIAKASLTIRVIDQTDRAVEGAVIELNSENEATTDAEGNAVFSELDPKTYSYVITELPERYSHDIGVQEINLAEASNETITLNVNREVTQRGISIRLIDQDENPVVGATIVLDNQTKTTNEAGRVVFSNLNPQVYTYQITELPEGYQGATEGEIELTEVEDIALDVRVEREIEPGTATITVIDQDNQPVHDATVKFGGLSQSTDTEGKTRFTSLEPGNYYYSVTEAPEGYTKSDEEKRVSIEEAMEFADTLAIERDPELGQVNIKVVNDSQKPITSVTVKLGDKEAVTNNEGIAAFEDLTPGDYQFEVTKAPAEYLLDTADATITVIANQTVTQTISLQTKPVESESKSSSETTSESQESEPDESETEAATQRYIDEATGVEVWVNPADAGQVVKLQVRKITNSLNPEPTALIGQKTDIFELVLLDRNNERVTLTRVAQVKLPTQPVTSQLKVVRVSGTNTSNLTFSLHNQKVNFSTQALGTFAILYGPQAESSSETASSQSQSESQQSTSVSVSKSTNVESADGDLPATGENNQIWSVIIGVLLLLLGTTLLVRRKRVE